MLARETLRPLIPLVEYTVSVDSVGVLDDEGFRMWLQRYFS